MDHQLCGKLIQNISLYMKLMFRELQILVFVNNIGYSLVFSTILAKLGRIYFIFHNPLKARKRVSEHTQTGLKLCSVCLSVCRNDLFLIFVTQNVSDWRMACFICIDIVFVLTVLTIGTSIPYTRPNAHTVPDAETPPREVGT